MFKSQKVQSVYNKENKDVADIAKPQNEASLCLQHLYLLKYETVKFLHLCRQEFDVKFCQMIAVI